jgi:asparagine synthetase B (glutamine-hydrolysing)
MCGFVRFSVPWFELALRIPDDSKLRDSYGKHVLRSAMADIPVGRDRVARRNDEIFGLDRVLVD